MAGLRDFYQGSHCHRKTWINLVFGVLQLLSPCVRQGGAQLQALAQMSSVVEVWQADEELLVSTQPEGEHSPEGLPQQESSSFYVPSGRALHFQPSVLDFGTQPVGLPRAETIYVHNPSQELPVTLISMFTSSRHFHMPSFQRRVIPPQGRTSFKVIFLPSQEGNVENSLFINTSSHGVLSYQIFGVGVHHGTLKNFQKKSSMLIFPHIQSIKLTQTQEDAANISILGLRLECSLPNKSYKYPQGFYFMTDEKLVMHISLSERGEKRADLEKLKQYILENIMVVFIFSEENGLWEPLINIFILNSGVKHLYVKEMQLLSRMENKLKFQQVQLGASATNFTHVASLICSGTLPTHERKCTGQISLQILGSYTLKSYPAFDITNGRSGYDLPTLFHMKQKQNGGDYVDVWLTNGFDFRFSVVDVTMHQEMESLLKIVNFSGPVSVPPGCWKVFSMKFVNMKIPMNVITGLVVVTSLGFSLQIPLQIRSSVSKGDLVFEANGECGNPCQLGLSKAGRLQWPGSLLLDSSTWRVDNSLAKEICTQWQSQKDHLTCRWPRLPMETSYPFDFGATPVNESKVKYFALKNPSASPVTIQLLALSSYPAPLEALDLLTKWFKINPLSVNVTTGEFTLVTEDHQDTRKTKVKKGARKLLLHLQPWEEKEIGVVFTPVEHKSVTSVILIRNNLTVFDMVMVKGHGAKELLRVGGKLPGAGASLRFNVPQSTLMECRDGLKTNKPLFAIRKSFKVENAGELPLTVMSMNINGYKCQGFGFEVLECRSFQLDYNSSSEINIAFTPDFTSSWVIRDLTIVTARGSTFPFTLNVTLPHHMLPLCAQVVPGPSWEETFWVVTIIFTCFSLGGVCLMAFYQAQYILSEFTSPGSRQNHNSIIARDTSPVDTISPNSMSKVKGSCKTFVDSCNTSDKSKGKGSLAVANGPIRSQYSSKKNSGAPAQPQKKHKVSVYYTKYKVSSAASITTPTNTTEDDFQAAKEPDSSEHCTDQDSSACNNTPEVPALSESKTHLKEPSPNFKEDKEVAPVMFPMEMHSSLSENTILTPGSGPGLCVCSPAEKSCNDSTSTAQQCGPFSQFTEKRGCDKKDTPSSELKEDSNSKKKHIDKTELGNTAVNGKARRNTGRNRKKATEGVTGVPEHSVPLLGEKNRDIEWRENRNPNRSRNRYSNGKQDGAKPGPVPESPVKQMQNGVCWANPRRKCQERRLLWESGSDSGSSSGSVRASRGSWGSWSSASSLEGEKDHNGAKVHCPASTKKMDLQPSVYMAERDCCQTLNSNFRTERYEDVHNLYPKELCQTPDSLLAPNFNPTFADVAAGVERNMGMSSPYSAEEMWSAPSIPLTNEFRYNATESLSCIPHGSSHGFYNGFLWSNANTQCTFPYPYCEQNNYCSVLEGNANLQNAFPCQERPTMPYSPQHSWAEDNIQDATSAWDTTGCVGSKPYFSGTRSLSPMSSLFGSIWTPQSEPYQSHFQLERAVPQCPQSHFVKEQTGTCRPKQYSSFDPFGAHMNLDIWNSSTSRSPNSLLSNDSGYCGDI
nr:PREDICTED: transmembrane protein 131-like isoform X3 [Lepisosteus oculatus]